VASERTAPVQRAYPEGKFKSWQNPLPDKGGDSATFVPPATQLVRGWMESTGPMTATALAHRLGLPREAVDAALARLESEGQVLRGRFAPGARAANAEIEWCNRRLLARIHRLTLGRLRKEIEPVTAADFMRFLFAWQHVTPGTQLHGVDGTLQIVRQLQGYEISAASWESDVLPKRVARYTPDLLDRLCLSGEVMWGRLSPHPSLLTDVNLRGRRVRPTRVAPMAIFLRAMESRTQRGPLPKRSATAELHSCRSWSKRQDC